MFIRFYFCIIGFSYFLLYGWNLSSFHSSNMRVCIGSLVCLKNSRRFPEALLADRIKLHQWDIVQMNVNCIGIPRRWGGVRGEPPVGSLWVFVFVACVLYLLVDVQWFHWKPICFLLVLPALRDCSWFVLMPIDLHWSPKFPGCSLIFVDAPGLRWIIFDV